MAEKGKMGNQSSGGNSKQRRAERRAQKPTTINNNSTTKKTHSTIKSESLSNAASMSIERQNLGREKVGKLIQSGGGAIALIIASLTGAIQISGVISMEVAYLLIAVAWLTFVAAIYTSERLLSASNKHTARVILIAGILSGVILFGFAFWLAFKKAEIEKKAETERLKAETERLAAQSKSTTTDRKLRAYLVPASDPSPPNVCGEIPSNAMAIYLGSGMEYTTGNRFTLISANNVPLLGAKKTATGLLIDLRLFDSKGKEIANIIENKFVGEVPDNLDVQSPDAHSIDIFDKNNNRHLFHIRYLNPKAVEILGIFYHPKTKLPLKIDKEVVSFPGGNEFQDYCFGGVGEGGGVNY